MYGNNWNTEASTSSNPDHDFSVWAIEPTTAGKIVYAFVVPIITGLGLIFNFLNGIIFTRPRMSFCSTYCYLLGLSIADFFSCFFLFFSSLSRSIWWDTLHWTQFDAMIHLSFGGISSAVSDCITVGVTLDRLFYINNKQPKKPPRFCNRNVARQFILVSLFISIFLNIPYFFIVKINEEGVVTTTEFFYSRYYAIHNWVKFILLGILPAIFLIIANCIMIKTIHKWARRQKQLEQTATTVTISEKKRLFDQTRLTTTMIALIFLYIIGEIPSYLASRRSAITLLYHGDIKNVNAHALETFRIVATLLNALHISVNHLIYIIVSPLYLRELLYVTKLWCYNCCCWCCIVIPFLRKRISIRKPTPVLTNDKCFNKSCSMDNT